MIDMTTTVIPKSDQLNFDDLIGGKTMTIKVTDVSLTSGDQPVAISFDGDNGKPYRPCKSMRRVLINAWGEDGKRYVGQSMTIYGDPDVIFGGAKVGGIRISHMSGLKGPLTMALTATKASRKPFTVKPLAGVVAASREPVAPQTDKDADWSARLVKRVEECASLADLEKLTAAPKTVELRSYWSRERPELAKVVDGAVTTALMTLSTPPDDSGDPGFGA